MSQSDIAGKRILVIEDDTLIQRLLEQILKNAGALVFCASDGSSGLRRFHIEQPDLVVLNVHLPKVDGWQVCRRIREEADVPILFLTTAQLNKRILAQESCESADFLHKPFNLDDLLTQVHRSLYAKTAVYQDDVLRVDLENGRVTLHGEPVYLTQTEQRLLAFLVLHAGIVLTYEQILRRIWGWDHDGDPSLVHVNISRLRRKIEPDPRRPRYLLLAYGRGYYFNPRL